MNFRRANDLFAWICCAIATVVYLVTAEPTVSFWDCGEFLSCAAKLEVAHSPGAPLFMLIQHVAGLFAFGNKANIAFCINAWSGIASGLTILFLFWTITYFAKRAIATNAEPGKQETLLIIASGVIGSLAYTFSDTFWYSAVEAEVYATSSLFTAIVLWAILKWEQRADDKRADKWLLFIAYMIGLSVGIHLLNLLALPAIAMVYYYRRYPVTGRNTLIALATGLGLVAFVQFGILQFLPAMAKAFELFFVNSIGLPFDSGVWIFLLLLIAVMVALLQFAKHRQNYLLHTATLAVLFIIIGFSSYFAPVLRSRADVPVDMANPDNVVNLSSYIRRQQYAQQPLLYGPDFTSIRTGWKQGDAEYKAAKKNGKDQYIITGYRKEPEFQEGTQRLFPRLWDVKNREQVNFYRRYLDIPDNELAEPGDNMKFFFKYQLGWMWWRYLMWNYAGRQNDVEGQGDAKNGNWISGIEVIDNHIRGLGDMNRMGDGYRNNAARNQFFLLPFALGIIGLVGQWKRSRRDAIIVAVFFFYTGIALAAYLNMGPMQSRERDYAFAGSNYAFAIWIGMGVLMVAGWLQKLVKGANGAYAAVALCFIAVPVLMAQQGWDDHNRSGKTIARATALNMLQSCEQNAILFTYGDNYTYPLWYLQEVENIRRDVRVINIGLMEGSWYIDQLNYKINDADAVPMLWNSSTYMQPSTSSFIYRENAQVPAERYFSLSEICRFMADDKNMVTNGAEQERYYPVKNFFLPSLSKAVLLQSNMLSAEDTGVITNEVKFTCPQNRITRATVAMYNIIAANAERGWKRPVYFADGIAAEDMAGLQNYARLQGCIYRLLPFSYNNERISEAEIGTTDAAKSFELLTKTYTYGGASRNDVYFDAKNRLALYSYRVNAGRVASALAAKGDKQKAIVLLDHITKQISQHSYFYDATMFAIVVGYYQAGANDKAAAIAMQMAKNNADDIRYIRTLSDDAQEMLASEMKGDFSMINALGRVAEAHGDRNTNNALKQQFQSLAQQAE